MDHDSPTCVNCPIRETGVDHEYLKKHPIAYFCSEYGIEEELPIYAGGLGILAGDFIEAAGDKGIPLVALGLFHRRGFTTFHAEDGSKESPVIDPYEFGFSILQDENGQPIVIDVEADSKVFHAQVWTKMYGSVRLFLFDTDFDGNTDEDKGIAHHLYDGRFDIRVMQELLLGVGGVKLLRRLGIEPSVYHLNEGHTSFAALALCVEYLHDHPNETSLENALQAIKSKIVSTKHTILSAAGTHFSKQQFMGILDTYLTRHRADFDEFFSLGLDISHSHQELFSTTKFMINSSIRTNAVSMLHAVFEKREHPYGDLQSITNGVHVGRWFSPLWSQDGIGKLSDEELWAIHEVHREKLTDFIKDKTGTELNAQALTVVWARRFAAYKRPEILFSDVSRLEKLLGAEDKPVQIILSGQASAHDKKGIELIQKIIAYTKEKRFKNKIVYLPNYSIEEATMLTRGADIWLSTPIRGREACGTSSMKSGLNGVLQCSTSDGWLEEVDWTDKGWILPATETEKHIYDVFEKSIVPAFYDRSEHGVPEGWVKRMRNTITIVRSEYSAERMLDEYLHKLYFPCGNG